MSIIGGCMELFMVMKGGLDCVYGKVSNSSELRMLDT